ncbi:MAG: TetR/AcrR family transcriptional regulator [Enterocloster asparagiformis]|nr:TetR/AcrR family transcriptional regulator [Enterocloster asparagiformis]
MNVEREIIESGIELFKEFGYDNTTVGMICKKANISKGTFYYHFQNKNDIIYGYVDSFISDINSALPEILELDEPKEQLWALYKYAFEHIISMNPKLLLAYYKADMDNHLKQLSPTSSGTYMYHTNAYVKILHSLIKKCQKSGSICPAYPAEDLLISFSSAIVGTGLDWACNNGAFDEIEHLRKIFNVIFSE